MGLTVAERKAVTREVALRYVGETKARKGVILDELCALTGWHRDYARRVLRTVAARPVGPMGRPRRPPRKRRPPHYGDDVIAPLRVVWLLLDFPCGKRLRAVLDETISALERHGELHLSPEVRTQLSAMSAATIDRRLAKERAKFQLKGRSGTKPGSMLKGQIPIRTFADWDDTSVGFCQVDLVAHEGGDGSGEFCQTLTLTDVATGWTEARALRNKARRWVIEAIDDIRSVLPFPLLGLDSDNGSEFINAHLLAYCEDHQITFTRGRPYRKNDSCHVEQKNWAIVRQSVGYARYDTPDQLAVLRQLYRRLRLLTNFFCPQVKLVAKARDGAKVTRHHDTPRTPYQRVLASGVLTDTEAEALTVFYHQLNLAQLRRDIQEYQRQLRVLVVATKTA